MIRLATKEDHEDCLRMARAFHEASPYKNLEFSSTACSGLFRAYLDGDKTDLIIILLDQDGPKGMIIGVRSSLPFSEEKVCIEQAWWVDEESRGRESLQLIMAYEEWARVVKSKITGVAMLDSVTDLSKFYERRGYSQAERTFIKET